MLCVSVLRWCGVLLCSKHPFRAMCCPVNMYCDRDISCTVIVTYYVLISVLLVSYGRGSIVVRAHASHAEGLRLESDSMP